jgi:RNA polymerase sigma-70 factor (ECF subfamily)
VAAIERLTPDDRLVIGLRWFVELDEAAMAAALNVPRGTVKSRLARAMRRLREEVGTDV